MQDEDLKSVLQMEHVVFDNVSFVREGFQQANGKEPVFSLKVGIRHLKEGSYRVSLSNEVEKENEYKISILISGYFLIDEECKEKDALLKQNAVAVLFPFVRSELSILTAQPETSPIVLPIMNIAAMMENAEKLPAEDAPSIGSATNN